MSKTYRDDGGDDSLNDSRNSGDDGVDAATDGRYDGTLQGVLAVRELEYTSGDIPLCDNDTLGGRESREVVCVLWRDGEFGEESRPLDEVI